MIAKLKILEPQLTLQAKTILEKRYLETDHLGNVIETPGELFFRVAQTVAQGDSHFKKGKREIEETTEKFYQLLTNLEFLPNSPTLLYAQRGLGQLSACFVLPIEDSLESVFTTLKNAVLVQWAGGGMGFNFSKIRPFGDSARNIPGVAAGPIHFVETFDTALNRVMQGGIRHGGNMGILNVDHPDILDFIALKKEEGRIRNFNLSIGVTDEFMKKVENDEEYELINPKNELFWKKIRAREVFDLLATCAWEMGEPGVVFLDEIARKNPLKGRKLLEATNPCGEQPLSSYESCNLGSINLAKVFEKRKVNWKKLRGIVNTAVHFLDNVIEVNRFPIPEIKNSTLATRKIGLGVMGLAHLFCKLGVRYDSFEAEELTKKIMHTILSSARKKSEELAKERGPFPEFKYSAYKNRKKKLRNATLTTIAPTGSISLIASVSSGIEPIYSLVTVSKVLFNTEHEGMRMTFIDPLFEQTLKEKGLYSERLINKVGRGVPLKEIKKIPKELKEYFITSHDVTPEWHIRIQAAAQKYTDNAVSKTINFPHSATAEDVKNAFFLAWKLKCKGVTVYRDKSRTSQILSSS